MCKRIALIFLIAGLLLFLQQVKPPADNSRKREEAIYLLQEFGYTQHQIDLIVGK